MHQSGKDMLSNSIAEVSILESFSAFLSPREIDIFQDIKEYITWETEHGGEVFKPDASDDISIRTYLIISQSQGKNLTLLNRIRASLKYFYTWLKANGLISEDPFEKNDLGQPLLPQEQIKPRHDAFPGLPSEREIARLQALNRLAESTNRSLDVQSMLDGTLETLLGEMNLQTAWVSLKYDGGFLHQTIERPVHGFVLAAAHNLPPSLEQGNRHYLRRPPMCNCQKLLDTEKLKRGVNVVECSRLQDAAATSLENNGLMFHASVPIICNDRTIGVMNFAAKEWELLSASDLQFLTAGARQIGAALERARLYDQIRVQHTHLQHELEMARKVQVSMLPQEMPKIPGYSLAALWKPAYETSGDYYNIFKLPGGRWGFIVADVCDKGAPAALYMALAHGLIRERVEKETSPAALLAHVNRELYQQGLKTNFITSFYAILDPDNLIMKYALAGHPAPLLRRTSGQVESIPGKGIALGIFPDAKYKDMEISLAPGESLVAFTDGLTDANNQMSEFFEMKHLKEAIGSAPASAKALLTHLQHAIDGWVNETPKFDDMTLLVVGRKPHPQRE
jgi:serine phosphatase RsbU (regulator of sigma subunit)